MPRVKRGVTARARHKKVLKQARGYYGARSRVYRVAKQAVIKAGQYCIPRSSSKENVNSVLYGLLVLMPVLVTAVFHTAVL